MTMRKGEENIILEDLDYIKSIEAVNRYMNFGVSGYQDAQEKVLHYKCLQNKFIESQNKIEDHMIIIETIADNHPPNRKRGALFDVRDKKLPHKNTRRRGGKKLIPLNIKHNELVKGYMAQRESSTNDLSSERTNRGNSTNKRKNSIMSKKSTVSKDHINDSAERSKLNLSDIKSEYTNKKDTKNDKTISNLNLQEIYNNNLINSNDHDSKTRDLTLIRKKLSNLKSGSILKNSNDNLFLTKIDSTKQNENFINFDLNINNISSNNKVIISTDDKRSSMNLNKVSFDEHNLINNKSPVEKSTRKSHGVLFDPHTDENRKELMSHKKNTMRIERERKSKKEKSMISKSTAVNATGEPNINESVVFDNKETPLFKKVEKKKNYENEDLITNKSKRVKSMKDYNYEKFGSRNNLINLTFSDSESENSFLNFNNKNNKQLLLNNKLPPLKIGNSNNNSEAISIIDYKIRNRSLIDNINSTNLNSNQQKSSFKTIDVASNNIKLDNLVNEGDEKNDVINKDNKNQKKYFIPDINGSIYNLKLPKLYLHQKNKSHLDILDSITKELKSSFNTYNYSNNNISNNIQSNLNSNIQSFMIQQEDSENFHSELYDTQENKLKALNMNRIKPKILPLELDKPKHNNSRQAPKSQIFLKNFMNKCKNQQNNISIIMNDISNNIVKTNDFYKNENISVIREIIENEKNHKVDKEIFLMDNPHGQREKTIILKGPPIKGENKYLFENKNSALLVGEVISKIDEDFALRCKEVVESRLIKLTNEEKRSRRLKEEAKIEKMKVARNNQIHDEIEKACEKIEKIKMNAMKERDWDEENQ